MPESPRQNPRRRVGTSSVRKPRGSSKPAETLDSAAVTEHPIQAGQIHPNVHFICRKLSEHGHLAVVVGGAVRDLMLGNSPKDFDLATSARPEEVKELFRNARIIGRRFRLVLVNYPDMMVEIATFRAEPGGLKNGMILRDNRYGTLKEDVQRRDFTINALTLDPLTLTVYDYVGAIDDLHAGILRTIKPPEESFQEDPVRMLRAVRFQCRLGMKIEAGCKKAISKAAPLLSDQSRHRLADELQRVLTSGHAEAMCRELDALGLLRPLLNREPFPWFFDPGGQSGKKALSPLEKLHPLLKALDRWCREGAEATPPTVALLGLLVMLGPVEFGTFLKNAPEQGAAHQERELRLDPRLADMMAVWGFLNGQVAPALAIIRAARQMMAMGPPHVRNVAAYAKIPGSREAWLLLEILREGLDIPEGFVKAGLGLLTKLPDLPILDHLRPEAKRRPPGDPHHLRSRQGAGGSGRKRSHRPRRGKR